MRLESQLLKRTPITFAVLVAASLVMLSCGTSTPNPNQTITSGLTFRAFVSNPLEPAAGGGGTPVLNIVNAATDQLTGFRISAA